MTDEQFQELQRQATRMLQESTYTYICNWQTIERHYSRVIECITVTTTPGGKPQLVIITYQRNSFTLFVNVPKLQP